MRNCPSRFSRRACRIGGVLAAVLSVLAPRAEASGTAFVIKSGGSILLARNLDRPPGDGYVFVNKRQVVKEAFGATGPTRLRWTSKYGSVTFNQFGREFPLGGINEQGLVIEELMGPAGYPAPDKRPPLSELQWIQYQLDNHRSVNDVLKTEARLRVSRVLFDLHFLVADRYGRTAVIEFVGGRMVASTGSDLPVRVLTNDSYAESIKYLNMHQGFGGGKPVPNGPGSTERFVRAAALLEDFLWPVPGVLSDHAFAVLRSVEQADTQWSIVYNISRRLVFFKTRSHRRLKIIRLDGLDFSCASPVVMLPVDTTAGWVVNGGFEPYDSLKNRSLLETVFKKLDDLGGGAGIPAMEVIRKMSEYPATCSCRS